MRIWWQTIAATATDRLIDFTIIAVYVNLHKFSFEWCPFWNQSWKLGINASLLTEVIWFKAWLDRIFFLIFWHTRQVFGKCVNLIKFPEIKYRLGSRVDADKLYLCTESSYYDLLIFYCIRTDKSNHAVLQLIEICLIFIWRNYILRHKWDEKMSEDNANYVPNIGWSWHFKFLA